MENYILRALPPKELKSIEPQLKAVHLEKGTILFEPGERPQYVYFPVRAIASYLSATKDGQTIEVAVVGNEGLIGCAAVLCDRTAFRATVQISGAAFRMRMDSLLEEFNRCGTLHQSVLNYTNALLVQVAQTAVCNKFHSVEQRFCRWLLLAQDRCGLERLDLTQDAIARILGARRASVTVAAVAMQKAGIIRYSRGVITIPDRKGLERASCECYERIADARSYASMNAFR